MSRYKPTPEMVEFAKECCRVHGLSRAGLSTDEDFDKLEHMGNRAQRTQNEANAEADRQYRRWE